VFVVQDVKKWHLSHTEDPATLEEPLGNGLGKLMMHRSYEAAVYLLRLSLEKLCAWEQNACIELS
jgi:hypothetical protein